VVLAGVQPGGLRAARHPDGEFDLHPAGFFYVIPIIAENGRFRDINRRITRLFFLALLQFRGLICH